MYCILILVLYLVGCSAKIRHYYIAAVEVEWDYAPSGENMVTKDTMISDSFINKSNNRIGSIYTKVVYREFTDDTFKTRVPSPGWMGILGPLIRAEVGDEMHVHFMNLAYNCGKQLSVHPHGVLYNKRNEGAIYLDKTTGIDKTDDGVPPGQNHTYIWTIPPEFGPKLGDPACIPWGYHSHVNSDKDIDTGLIGLLLTCKTGTLDILGKRKDYSKEFIIYMDIADENNAWMIRTNLQKCGDPAQCIDNPDPGFTASNVMWHINGYVYGNLPGLEVNVGEKVIWYIMSLNSGIHSISFSGNTLIHRNHRVDTIPFLPSTFLSAEMIPANEGDWLLYSRVSENYLGGMAAFYKVNRKPTIKRKRHASLNSDNSGQSFNPQDPMRKGINSYPLTPWYSNSGAYRNPWYRTGYWRHNPYGWGFMYPGGYWNYDPFGSRRVPIPLPPVTKPTSSSKPPPVTEVPKDTEQPSINTKSTLPATSNTVQTTATTNTPIIRPQKPTTKSQQSTTPGLFYTLQNAWKRRGTPIFVHRTPNYETGTNSDPGDPYNPFYPFKVGSFFSWAATSGRVARSVTRQSDAKRTVDEINEIRRRNIKRYYLSIEKENWNYAPSGQDKFNGGTILENPKAFSYFERGPTRIGGEYIKAMYVEYTDGSFTERVVRTKEEMHLGLLGPPIVGEVSDDLVVVLRNNADRPYSFLPHGVVYKKEDEGFSYKDMKSGNLTGKIVSPGGTETYTFSVPNINAGPTVSDPPCITHTYQSAVDPVRDLNTGLFGPVVICKRGQLKNVFNKVNKRSWFFNHKHIYLAFITIDENLSWYIDENIRAYTWTSTQVIDKDDPSFRESNAMHSINGLLYGNLKGIEMCINDNVLWHLMDFGGTTDMHGVYIHGQTWVEFGNNIDAKGLLPGYSSTMWSKPDTVGTWGLVCRTNSHFENGMVAEYTVNQCNRQTETFGNTKIRKYYIAAVEVEWDYAPLKRSVINGDPINTINEPGGIFITDNDFLIGSIYKKALYRLFNDSTFTSQVARTHEEEHLEIMGPYIKAEIGERIEVVFKNMASKPLSIHAQGLHYSKAMEGAKYGTGQTMKGSSVAPGQTFTYKWTVPQRAGPGINDPNCVGRMYYSSVDAVVDTYTGLFGPLVICRKGILDDTGKRWDVDKEFAVMFMVIDENKSFYIKENVQKYAPMHYKMIKSHNGTISEQVPSGETRPIKGFNPILDHGGMNHMGNHNIMDMHHNHISLSKGHHVVSGRPQVTNNKGNSPLDAGSQHIQLSPTANDASNSIMGVDKVDERGRKKRGTPMDTAKTSLLSKNLSNDLPQSSLFLKLSKILSTSSFRPEKYTNTREKRATNTSTSMIPNRNIHMNHIGNGEMMFEHSNHMNSINGRLMGNLNGIVMDQNDKVAWYIMGLGSAEDYHPVHIHGQVFTRRSDRAHGSDVIEVFPSTSDTVEMLAVNPGNWILHCHFSKHNKNGMQLIYTVNPKP